jgi:hypothetical protein
MKIDYEFWDWHHNLLEWFYKSYFGFYLETDKENLGQVEKGCQ